MSTHFPPILNEVKTVEEMIELYERVISNLSHPFEKMGVDFESLKKDKDTNDITKGKHTNKEMEEMEEWNRMRSVLFQSEQKGEKNNGKENGFLWEEIFAVPFLSRMKQLIEEMFEYIHIEKTMNENFDEENYDSYFPDRRAFYWSSFFPLPISTTIGTPSKYDTIYTNTETPLQKEERREISETNYANRALTKKNSTFFPSSSLPTDFLIHDVISSDDTPQNIEILGQKENRDFTVKKKGIDQLVTQIEKDLKNIHSQIQKIFLILFCTFKRSKYFASSKNDDIESLRETVKIQGIEFIWKMIRICESKIKRIWKEDKEERRRRRRVTKRRWKKRDRMRRSDFSSLTKYRQESEVA